MEYRFLGRSGLKVSVLCLGTLTFGRETPQDESETILNRYVSAGGNFIDTADVYSQGGAEAAVGRWLHGQQRDALVLASKVRYPTGAGPNDVGLSRKHLLTAVEGSLRRLGTDYLDLYQLHCWDHRTPLEETLDALNDLVRCGKVRYVGVSNFAGWQVQKAVMLAAQLGCPPIVSLQPQYNLLCRTAEWELLPVCEAEGLGVLPWSPLRGGWLSGRYRRGMETPPADSRIAEAERSGWGESWSAYNTERTWALLDELIAVAADVSRTPAQVAINWLLQRPGVTAPIIGARTLRQFEDSLGSVGWSLDAAQAARLDSVSGPGLPYPYDEIAGARARR